MILADNKKYQLYYSIRYFPVVIKHCDQGNLWEIGFIWVYGSRAFEFIVRWGGGGMTVEVVEATSRWLMY